MANPTLPSNTEHVCASPRQQLNTVLLRHICLLLTDVSRLSVFFRRQPKLLVDLLQDTVDQKSALRPVLLNALMDVEAIEQAMVTQYVLLKHGGRVSDSRWTQKFSPVIQETVRFACL